MISRKVLKMIWNLGVSDITVNYKDLSFNIDLDFSQSDPTSEVIVEVKGEKWKQSTCLEYIQFFFGSSYLYDRYNELPPFIFKQVKKAFNSKEVKRQIYVIYDKAIDDNFNITDNGGK